MTLPIRNRASAMVAAGKSRRRNRRMRMGLDGFGLTLSASVLTRGGALTRSILPEPHAVEGLRDSSEVLYLPCVCNICGITGWRKSAGKPSGVSARRQKAYDLIPKLQRYRFPNQEKNSPRFDSCGVKLSMSDEVWSDTMKAVPPAPIGKALPPSCLRLRSC
jgi:hypothetical protein